MHLDFAPRAYKRLNDLRKMAGVNSNADLFRNALRLYEWYVEKISKGYRVSVSKDGERAEIELVLDPKERST